MNIFLFSAPKTTLQIQDLLNKSVMLHDLKYVIGFILLEIENLNLVFTDDDDHQ